MASLIAAPVNKTVDSLEAASILGISRSTLYVLLRLPGFPRGARLGRRRVWLVSDLFDYLENQSRRGIK